MCACFSSVAAVLGTLLPVEALGVPWDLVAVWRAGGHNQNNFMCVSLLFVLKKQSDETLTKLSSAFLREMV